MLLHVAVVSNDVSVSRCDSESDTDVYLVAETLQERRDNEAVGDDSQNLEGWNFSPTSDVETACVFPKNPSKFKFTYLVYSLHKVRHLHIYVSTLDKILHTHMLISFNCLQKTYNDYDFLIIEDQKNQNRRCT